MIYGLLIKVITPGFALPGLRPASEINGHLHGVQIIHHFNFLGAVKIFQI
jgi:hypothetical protein